ncbi:TPA: hypothetical protein ACX6SV_000654 [Photobacterium damselae]
MIFESPNIEVYVTDNNHLKIEKKVLVLVLVDNPEKDSYCAFAAKNTSISYTIKSKSFVIKLKMDFFSDDQVNLIIGPEHNDLIKKIIEVFSENYTCENVDFLEKIIFYMIRLVFNDEKDFFQKINNYITHNISNEHLTPLMIAEHFSISQRKLYYIFKSKNKSLSNHINHLRIERLKELLFNNNRVTMKIIKKECGFKSDYLTKKAYREYMNNK